MIAAGPTAPDTHRRRALVLAGGGMRVAYQAGVLLALEQAGLGFELMDGASGGTINLAMRLSGLTSAQMCERWRTLDVRDFVSLLSLKEYLTPGGLPAFGGSAGLRDRVFPHLGVDVRRIRAARDVRATFNVCNYTDKLNVAVPHPEVDLDLLVAAVSLPMFTPPVERAGKLYVDSVWIKDANLTAVVQGGAQEIWLVWCIGNTDRYNPGTLEQYVHMIEICANASLFAELAWIAELNRGIREGRGSPYGQLEPIAVHVIKPAYALPLDPEYLFGKIDADTLISMGYSDAVEYLRTAEPRGVPLDPTATRMKATRRGVAFQGRFTGRLSAPAGPTANLRLVVRIPELAEFLGDGGHEAPLYGSADLPGLGERLPLCRGRFRVEPDGAGRLVVFEAVVAANGRRYRLRGSHSLLDAGAIAAMCTMRLEIRPDAPGAGPLATATLALNGGLPALIASVRAVGAQGLAERAEVRAQLLRFYGRPAWGSRLAVWWQDRRELWQAWAGRRRASRVLLHVHVWALIVAGLWGVVVGVKHLV